jgi:alkyl sulfatase BDS1-like metallo-beta-lactamase superfamily hydrolase
MVRDFGRDKIMKKARKAYKSGDYRWALTLATHVWRYENKSLNDALYWRTQSIKRLAENLPAVQWRNYLFTEAMVDWKVLPSAYLDATLIKSRLNYMVLHTLENCFTLLSVHLNAQLADGVDKTIDLSVANDPNLQPGQVYRLRIKNSVLTVNKVAAVEPLNSISFPFVQTNNATWRQVLSGLLTIDQALAANTVSVVRGTSNDIKGFLAYFDFVDQL